jgi:hypothetical protein
MLIAGVKLNLTDKVRLNVNHDPWIKLLSVLHEESYCRYSHK